VVILYGEFHEAGGRPDSRLAKGGVADAQHAELSWQAIQVQANAVEVGIGGAASQCRRDRILRCGILRHGFLGGIQQNGVNVGQFSEHSEKRRKFGGGAGPYCAGNQLMLHRGIRPRVQYARYELPGPRRRKGVGVAVNVGLKVVSRELPGITSR